jgi:bifunctional DNA-binding transcriptional regulator/antitoxin component of YhaV-PrlF toxin-antitoxin module
MPTVRITAKRQATFPRATCEALGVGPGDVLELQARVIDGETVWLLRPRRVDWSWIGSVRVPAGASHDVDAIRRSAARGWGHSAGKR